MASSTGKINAIPIGFAEEGDRVAIYDIRGGQNVRKRFADMGFLPGESAPIIRNCRFGGPMLLEIKGSRFVIGRAEAQKILVIDC